MRWKKISDAVVRRLPLYLRVLEEVSRDEDRKLMSSQELGERAGVSPALVRKDLAWFGEFGKQGVGYEVSYLRDELRRILNLDEKILVALVGVGSLGQALTRYNKNRTEQDRSFNIEIVALFDNDPSKFGKTIEGIAIRPVSELAQVVKELGVQMAIVTVPADQAQVVVDAVVQAGIRAILNFAPTKLVVPEGVHVASADLSLELQRLAYYLDD
jgi:AT-rich DNA-binding protein